VRIREGAEPQRGATAVEMAIVLPILFLLLFGIIEFGFIFNRWITVTHAAREGVRTYSLTGDPAQGIQKAMDSSPDLTTDDNLQCTATPATGPAPSGTPVEIECSADYDMALFIFEYLWDRNPQEDPVTVTSAAEMRRE
jgi:Flp pilus assembly protein TadG